MARLSAGTSGQVRAIWRPPAIVVAMLATWFVARANAAAQEIRDEAGLRASRAAVERAITDTPDYLRFFDRLRIVLPVEYEALMKALAEADARKPLRSADAIMDFGYDALRRVRGRLAAKATDAALDRLFAIQLQELRAMARMNPRLCLPFLQGTSDRSFLAFAAGHRALVADAAIAGIEAMSSGRIDKVQRAAPSEADFQKLDEALVAKGLSRPEIGILLDAKTVEPPIADERMCEAGRIYLETLAHTPDDARHRLYSLAAKVMAKPVRE